MSKTIRKPFTGSKKFSRGCRNHGSCSWCRSNRMFSTMKQLAKADAS